MKKLIAVILLVAVVSLCGCSAKNTSSTTANANTNLEDKYYSYAQECIEKGDNENAVSALEEGIKKTGSKKLKQLLDEITKKIEEESKITVETAIDYQQPLAKDPSFDWEPDPNQINTYKVPKISLKTENANIFNGKLLGHNNYFYERLKSGEMAHYFVECDYKYKIYNNDLIAITLFAYIAKQHSGGSSDYYTLYFSASEDRELTFDEYLSLIGLTKDGINQKSAAHREFIDAFYYPENMTDLLAAMFDEESSFVIYKDDYGLQMNDWFDFEFESFLN